MTTPLPTHPGYILPACDVPLKLIRKAFPPIKPPPLPALTLRIPVKVTQSPSRAHLPFHYPLLLPPALLKSLKQMSLLHAQLTDATFVTASIKVVRGTPCTRWHVDKVPLRGLCTLHGPGCVLKTDREGVLELAAGDMVFIPGSGYDNDRMGVLHKSPDIGDRDMRLVLQTDCVDVG